MTPVEFCERIKHAVPDDKDIMRAADICSKATVTEFNEKLHKLQRTVLADKQLKAITDDAKFFRRIKSFLDSGILVNLANTRYSTFWDNDTVREYFIDAVHSAENTMEFDDMLAFL